MCASLGWRPSVLDRLRSAGGPSQAPSTRQFFEECEKSWMPMATRHRPSTTACASPRFAPERSQQLRARLRDFAARAGDGRLAVRSPAVQRRRHGARRRAFPSRARTVPAGCGLDALRPAARRAASGRRRSPAAAAAAAARRTGRRLGRGASPSATSSSTPRMPALSCHLAHEAEPGRPGILHLEARRGGAGDAHPRLAERRGAHRPRGQRRRDPGPRCRCAPWSPRPRRPCSAPSTHPTRPAAPSRR